MDVFDGDFRIGDLVCIETFNGTGSTDETARPAENYWLLVGQTGVIVKTWREAAFEMPESRFLGRFDENLNNLGLCSHNEIENSLWILGSDISFISGKK